MPTNIGIFKDPAFTEQYSVDKQPYEPGYNPIFGDVVFNATDGDAHNVVVYVSEIHTTKDFYYTDVQVSPVETAQYQRDPDQDGVNEWHVYISTPVETSVNDEVVGTGDGQTREFALSHRWVKPGSESIRLGNTVQKRNIDYWINYARGRIRFATPPANGVTIYASYVHGDDGNGNVNIPSASQIEANGDWTWTPVWDIPHGYDTNRGDGYERDGIPVIIRGKVDPGTTDPEGNAITLWQQQIRVRGWEHNAKY